VQLKQSVKQFEHVFDTVKYLAEEQLKQNVELMHVTQLDATQGTACEWVPSS